MKILRKIWMGLILPIEAIISVAVLIDESRRQNLDGSWDKYWGRKNRRSARRANGKTN